MEDKYFKDEEIITLVNAMLIDSEYCDFKIAYILKDKNKSEENYAVAVNGDELISINPLKNEIVSLPDWDFTADNDLFRDLEHNMEISYMSLYCHYGIWHEINNYYPDDISHKKGMQNYLKYCKKNDVTLDTIKKKFGNTHLPDVMQYLKKERKERER